MIVLLSVVKCLSVALRKSLQRVYRRMRAQVGSGIVVQPKDEATELKYKQEILSFELKKSVCAKALDVLAAVATKEVKKTCVSGIPGLFKINTA